MISHRWFKSLFALGLVFSVSAAAEPFGRPGGGGGGHGGPGGGFHRPDRGNDQTERAIRTLKRAQALAVGQQFRIVEDLLSDAQRALSFLRRDRDIREAIRALDEAEEVIRRFRGGDRARATIRMVAHIRGAISLIERSYAHRGSGGRGPGRGPGGWD